VDKLYTALVDEFKTGEYSEVEIALTDELYAEELLKVGSAEIVGVENTRVEDAAANEVEDATVWFKDVALV